MITKEIAKARLEDKTGYYTPLMVLRSAAGYYIGREYIEDDFAQPGTRESEGYYQLRVDAQRDLDSLSFVQRNSEENIFMYKTCKVK